MLKGSRALVAGGGGLMGSHLIARLLAEGCRVRATLHKHPAVVQNPSLEYLTADLTQMEDCRRAAEGMDYVFMCAANTSGAAVMTETPLAHVTPNIVMNAQLLEAAYKARVKKFLFVSSSAAYPIVPDRPVQEEDMFTGEPDEVYYSVGWMKRYVEILCKIYATKIKNPMPTVVIRPSNAYGPHDKFDFKTSHATAALIRRVVEHQKPIEVWGTGEEVRDLIYIDDLIEGMILAFQRNDPYLAINIATGHTYSVKQVLQTLLELTAYQDAEVRFDSSKPRTIAARLIDTRRAKELLGFEAKTSLKEGLRKTVAWYQKHAAEWPR